MKNVIICYTDGAARGRNPHGQTAAAFAAYDATGREVHHEVAALGVGSNNFAEYTALIMACRWADATNVTDLTIRTDSELMQRQVTGKYAVRAENIQRLLSEAAMYFAVIPEFRIEWVKAHNGEVGNERVDALCNFALDQREGK